MNPGWYSDPNYPARVRYWDGTAWTDFVLDTAPPTGPVTHGGGIPGWAWAVIGAIVSLFLLTVGGIAVTTSGQLDTSPQPEPKAQATLTTRVQDVLERENFNCQPRQFRDIQQCTKGSYRDPVYGPSPIEMVNIEHESPGVVHGYVRRSTLKRLLAMGIDLEEVDSMRAPDGRGRIISIYGKE